MKVKIQGLIQRVKATPNIIVNGNVSGQIVILFCDDSERLSFR
jgi:hypothetical protein